MHPFINSSDFQFISKDGIAPSYVKYLGSSIHFNCPARLTKFDVARCLDVLRPESYWLLIYDSFRYSELVSTFKINLGL